MFQEANVEDRLELETRAAQYEAWLQHEASINPRQNEEANARAQAMARNAELQTVAAQQYARSMAAAAEAMRANAEAEVRRMRLEMLGTPTLAPSLRPLVEERPTATTATTTTT